MRIAEGVDSLLQLAGLLARLCLKSTPPSDKWISQTAIDLIDSARRAGLPITTDMYMYNASSTGLNVLLPEWAKEGGHETTLKYRILWYFNFFV